MTDVQTYASKKEAAAELAKMRGWPTARVARLFAPLDERANRRGNVWVIEIRTGGDSQYLRSDGYVR